MPSRLLTFVRIVCMACFFVSVLPADALDQIITATQSTDAVQRIGAYNALVQYLTQQPVDQRVAPALINLLSLENSDPTTVDDDGDYYLDLIATTANLNDVRAISALVQVIGTGNLVPASLARLGSQVLDPILQRQSDPDWMVRKCVLISLINMLTPQNLTQFSDSTSIQKITSALEQGLQDQSSYVSSTALKGFQTLEAVLPTIHQAVNISHLVKVTSSGLAYSRVNQTFNGTVTVTNVSNAPLTAPLQVIFTSLSMGVSLVNATGSFAGNPYVTLLSNGLGAGQSTTVVVQFTNPSHGAINFNPVIYSGSLSQ